MNQETAIFFWFRAHSWKEGDFFKSKDSEHRCQPSVVLSWGSNVSVTYQPWKFSNKYQGNLGPRLDCTFNDGTYMLFLLSLSASVLSNFNSTRKQNYMMNFSRQHGLRHFYNRRRRSLRRNPWRVKSFFLSNMWYVAFHSFQFRTASDIRKFLWRTWWLTESPSQDQVYTTFPHCELMTSDLFSHK